MCLSHIGASLYAFCVRAHKEKFVKLASRRRAAAGASRLHYYYLATTSEFYVLQRVLHHNIDLRNKSICSLYFRATVGEYLPPLVAL